MRSDFSLKPSSSCARLFRCSHIRFTGRHLCRRGGVCSATCTRLLGFEATYCGMLYGAVALQGVHVAYLYRRAPTTTSDLTIRAFRGSNFPSVVQLPRVALEAHPLRADPPVDLVRQVWGFSDGTSQIDEGGCLAVLLPIIRCR